MIPKRVKKRANLPAALALSAALAVAVPAGSPIAVCAQVTPTPATTPQPASASSRIPPPPLTQTYEDHNQPEPRPIELGAIAGTIEDPGKIPFLNAMVLLFTEPDHTLIASTKSDGSGRFEFARVRPGLYRVVAKVDALCPANVPITVSSFAISRHKLRIVMQPQGYDTCSYGTTK